MLGEGAGAADMLEDALRIGLEALDFGLGVGVQSPEVVVMMIVRDAVAKTTPESFDGIAVWVVGRGIDRRKAAPWRAMVARTSREPSGRWVRALSARTIALRPRAAERATSSSNWRQNVSASRRGLKPKESPPSRQSTAPKPRHF